VLLTGCEGFMPFVLGGRFMSGDTPFAYEFAQQGTFVFVSEVLASLGVSKLPVSTLVCSLRQAGGLVGEDCSSSKSRGLNSCLRREGISSLDCALPLSAIVANVS
jgi:hypothetical protein